MSVKLYNLLILNQSRNKKDGAPGEIRTPDPLVRSQVLYPAELRAHETIIHNKIIKPISKQFYLKPHKIKLLNRFANAF